MKNKYKRAIVFTRLSIVLTAFVVIGKLLYGIVFRSPFIAFSAFYSVGIAVAKVLALITHNKSIKKINSTGVIEYGKEEYDCYLYVGVIVLAAGLAYVIYSARMFLGYSKSSAYPVFVAINIAAFTFTEIALSVRGTVLAKKDKEPIMEAIKLASVASSLILLTLTQTALLSFTYEGDASKYNGLSGIIFGGIAVLIGAYMAVSVSVKINKLQLAETLKNSNDYMFSLIPKNGINTVLSHPKEIEKE